MRKPSICIARNSRNVRFSSSGQKLSKLGFCHIRVKEPSNCSRRPRRLGVGFQNKPLLTGSSIYQVSTAACTEPVAKDVN